MFIIKFWQCCHYCIRHCFALTVKLVGVSRSGVFVSCVFHKMSPFRFRLWERSFSFLEHIILFCALLCNRGNWRSAVYGIENVQVAFLVPKKTYVALWC
nr:MAG TPA: hypothetical protein [Myoviridae sp. ct6nn14]